MLEQLAARYRTFLRQPDVVVMLATALLTRMPLGTVGFSMLMHLRDISGSFATAGATGGTYLASSAVFAPVLGRIVDRHGPRWPLVSCAIVCPLALLVILFARNLQPSAWQLALAAAIAGAFAPPITVLMRTIWRHRFADEGDRRTAFALDAVLVELAFTLGPALIGVVIAYASPTAAFAVAWTFVTIAVPVFAVSPALRYWRHDPDVERHLLGPLTEPKLWLIYAVTALLTFSLGMLEVGYPGFATAAHAPALAGMLLAVNSAGSAIGGVAFGGLHVTVPIERQLRGTLLLLAVGLALHVPATTLAVLAALAFAAGLFIAPSLAAATTLAPMRYATEAFTWSATFLIAGVGGGIAFAGELLERTSASAVFGIAACIALLAAFAASALKPHR